MSEYEDELNADESPAGASPGMPVPRPTVRARPRSGFFARLPTDTDADVGVGMSEPEAVAEPTYEQAYEQTYEQPVEPAYAEPQPEAYAETEWAQEQSNGHAEPEAFTPVPETDWPTEEAATAWTNDVAPVELEPVEEIPLAEADAGLTQAAPAPAETLEQPLDEQEYIPEAYGTPPEAAWDAPTVESAVPAEFPSPTELLGDAAAPVEAPALAEPTVEQDVAAVAPPAWAEPAVEAAAEPVAEPIAEPEAVPAEASSSWSFRSEAEATAEATPAAEAEPEPALAAEAAVEPAPAPAWAGSRTTAAPEPVSSAMPSGGPLLDDPVAAVGLYLPGGVEHLEGDMPVYSQTDVVNPIFTGEGLGEPLFVEFHDLARMLAGLRELLPKGTRLTYNYDHERAWIRSTTDVDLPAYGESVRTLMWKDEDGEADESNAAEPAASESDED